LFKQLDPYTHYHVPPDGMTIKVAKDRRDRLTATFEMGHELLRAMKLTPGESFVNIGVGIDKSAGIYSIKPGIKYKVRRMRNGKRGTVSVPASGLMINAPMGRTVVKVAQAPEGIYFQIKGEE
jgi:hypothetical protein